VYGQTEGYYNLRMLEHADKARNCIGRPYPIFDMAILDDNDSVLPHDGVAIGEIAVRPRLPYAMMTEYFDNPEATVSAFRNQWFHTGDLGSIDSENYVFLRGRKNDSIRRRGENVSAAEIEQEALAHAAVVQAAAFAVPSELGEDDIKLDVVLSDDNTVSVEEIANFLSGRLAAFMCPRYIQIRDTLPLTPSQRVQKFVLQQEGIANTDYDAGDGARKQNAKP